MRLKVIGAVTVAGVMAACGGGGSSSSGALTPRQIVDKTKNQAVFLFGKEGDSTVGGTGILIDAKRGLILTAAHVVAGVAALKARVGNQAETPARVIASSPCEDTAVVQMPTPPPNLQQATLGTSSKLRNLDVVVALGYPLSFADLSTEKVVSSDGKVQSPNVTNAKVGDGLPIYPSVIQHSATVNAGNSGGPLYDDHGLLVGMNTLSNPGSSKQPIQNQFYANSIDHIKQLLPALEAGKSTANAGWNLIPFSENYLSDVFTKLGLGTAAEGEANEAVLTGKGVTEGLIVDGLDSGSPAEPVVNNGDLITSLNERPVKTVSDVCDVLLSATPGAQITVKGIFLTDDPANNRAIGDAWVATAKLTLK